MLATIQKAHVHSVLFLASRLLFLVLFIAPRSILHTFVSKLLYLCALHQFALYFLGRRVRQGPHAQRTISRRFSSIYIDTNNGPVGRALAAVEVYLWEAKSHPNPVNLLHWLERAIMGSFMVELSKLRCACGMRLKFEWDSRKKTLFYHGLSRSEISQFRSEAAARVIMRIIRAAISSVIGSGRSENPLLVAMGKLTSVTVFFVWIFFGRKGLSCLHADPRERAYHVDSHAEHIRRRNMCKSGPMYEAKVFGVDLSRDLEKGISRLIHVDEMDNLDEMIKNIELDDAMNLVDQHGGGDSKLDHSSVFCVSYRHLENKTVEALSVVFALKIAAETTNVIGRTHFRVWLDKILRHSQDRPPERWAYYGLLPYAYYVVIAMRNVAPDEGERMWLLAEERLGYGNMGLFWVDFADTSIKFIPGVDAGPVNALRIYLRYLKTEEARDEKTYHTEDKRRFEALAETHGTVDDEQEMYRGLFSTATPTKGEKAVLESVPWPASVLDVESYACLRRESRKFEEIVFRRSEGIAYDGYREWFKFNNVRLVPESDSFWSSAEGRERAYNSAVAFVSACYLLRGQEVRIVVLLRNGNSGLLVRTACLCLVVEEAEIGLRITKRVRVQLKYETVPDASVFLKAIMEYFGSGEANQFDVREVSLQDLKFIY